MIQSLVNTKINIIFADGEFVFWLSIFPKENVESSGASNHLKFSLQFTHNFHVLTIYLLNILLLLLYFKIITWNEKRKKYNQ